MCTQVVATWRHPGTGEACCSSLEFELPLALFCCAVAPAKSAGAHMGRGSAPPLAAEIASGGNFARPAYNTKHVNTHKYMQIHAIIHPEFKLTLDTNREPPHMQQLFHDLVSQVGAHVSCVLICFMPSQAPGPCLKPACYQQLYCNLQPSNLFNCHSCIRKSIADAIAHSPWQAAPAHAEALARTQGANVIGLQYGGGSGGPVASILVSKAGGRYRVQSDCFQGMWLALQVRACVCVGGMHTACMHTFMWLDGCSSVCL